MTINYSAKNERVKREYFEFLKEAKRQNELSIDAVAKAIARFEEYNNYKDFVKFRKDQAAGFKSKLAEQVSQKTGEKLSKSTLCSTLRHLKDFFQWLSMQPGYKSKVKYTDADYFNASAKDSRVARAERPKRVPSINEIQRVVEAMPANTRIEKRDRAIVAFTILTGVRDAATISLKIKHIDLAESKVFQDAREVNTKASKTILTWFFPVPDIFKEMFVEWVGYLVSELGFEANDPLFPKTRVVVSDNGEIGCHSLIAEHWANATPVRKIFKRAFENVDLRYANPHSFRDTLAQFGERLCTTPEQFKAWSQNLGHEGVLTTLYSYGEVRKDRQGEIISTICSTVDGLDSELESAFEMIRRAKSRT